MDKIASAAQLFAAAWRAKTRFDALPSELQPASLDECHAIQDATVRMLGETIGGWKVGLGKDGVVTRAPIFARLIHNSGAQLDSKTIPMLAIESEIGFRFTKPLLKRDAEYSRDEVSAAVEAFPAIELLNSRYADTSKRSQLERVADCFIQGGVVCGVPRADWRSIDFSRQSVRLVIDGSTAANNTGSHPTGDPIGSVVALVNKLRQGTGVQVGQIMITGTWTGITSVKANSLVEVLFEGFKPLKAQFAP
jgi:2-keto-4-pentenoate hydratase